MRVYVHVFQNRNWCSSKSDRRFFFPFLTVRRPFHIKDFKWKKNMGVRGYFLEKRKLCIQNLKKERKQPPVVILQQSIFYKIFIRCLWLRIIRGSIRSRCLVHEFPFTDIFNDINHGYRAAILKKSSLWLLPSYMAVATYC